MTFSRCDACQHLLYAFDAWACVEAERYIADVKICPLFIAADKEFSNGLSSHRQPV